MKRNSGYSYGFNGKENDNEVKGQGNQQDYGMRIYDPRLGRFLSVDPLAKDFAWYTPYQFAGNKPIVAIDLDGLEDVYVTTGKNFRIMNMLFNEKDIKAIASGNTTVPRIHYDVKKLAVSQFEGPNKKNEEAIFSTKYLQYSNFIKNTWIPSLKEGDKGISFGLTIPVLIPEPTPPSPILPRTISARGIVKFGNLSSMTSGADYKGDPAGPGSIADPSSLNRVIKLVKDNDNVESLSINLTFSYNPFEDKSAAELSAKNGVANVKSYLKANGLKDIKINTSYSVVPLSEKDTPVNNININYTEKK
jgi:RHS repeat-associated protein